MSCSCWALYALTFNPSNNYTEYFCGQSAEFQVFEGNTSLRKVIYVDCQGQTRSLFKDRLGFESGVLQGSQLINGGNTQPPQQGSTVLGSCSSCIASTQTYDCVNHKCELSTKYNTPGLYKSLADCEAVCGKGGVCASGKQCLDPVNYCPPGKVCIEEGEHAKIQNLIQQTKNKFC